MEKPIDLQLGVGEITKMIEKFESQISNEILNYSLYDSLVMIDQNGKEIARITPVSIILTDDYIMKLKPSN
ncbi:hypothetical protein P7H46_06660 [Enterococcus pseudoavium]|uniref:DUF2292 domain-containing protein n=1 Tax=Enterococcus pseudoavium TaxID=44007 RepID=A0ABU3FHI6_9ENTE|nr:hypothetical protein [Enterococcus pseudoavium]MDT2770525.1 hypothetical protein [Enterococcus pseudoavium]